MVSEEVLKQSFKKVKEDMEGVKDELAFALKRIAKIESSLINSSLKQNSSKRKK